MDLVILLLMGGVLAIGLPHVTRRSRRRFWHPWVNSGLAPLVLGLLLGPLLEEDLQQRLQPLLALALAAAGVLVGTQLRGAYLSRAGALFLRRHSLPVVLLFLAVGVPALLALLALTDADPLTAVAFAGATGALCVVTSQRPPMASHSYDVRHRDVILGHIAPAGWWNLLALLLAGAALSLSIGRGNDDLSVALPAFLADDPDLPRVVTAPGWSRPLVEIALPMALGLVLGWLARRARDRDEAYLFLLAVLGVAGGAGLLLGSTPLFTGLLIGAVFANSALARAVRIEQALEGVEQPSLIATGLLAGLALQPEPVPGWAWMLMGGVLVVRWSVRGRLSPTSPTLSGRRERRLVPAGAAGVLVAGALATMGPAGAALVPPVVAGLVVLTAVHDLFELRGRRRELV